MIKVYFLEAEIVDGVETVKGANHIHNAILECAEKPNVRKLIQDTTDAEHSGLIAVAQSWREATKDELAQLNQMKAEFPIISPPRDLAKELDALKARIAKLEGKIGI